VLLTNQQATMSQIISLISAILAFIALSFTARGLFIAVERGRRELAANLLYNWSRDEDRAASRAIDLCKQLRPEDEAAIKLIKEKRKASISQENYDSVIAVLSEKFTKEDLPKKPESAVSFEITEEQSRFIHYLWFRWLNRLEGTLAAWLEDAADRELMEREFAPLVRYHEEQLELLFAPGDLPILSRFHTDVNKAQRESYDKIMKSNLEKRSRIRLLPTMRRLKSLI
jgi:hypothetical protein